MDTSRIHPARNTVLPPITSLIPESNGTLPASEPSPIPFRSNHHSADMRDSGNWSASKHSSGISNNGFQLQSILNNEDSPVRHSVPASIPEMPHSTKTIHSLPPITQAYDPRASVLTDASSILDQSRRSSIHSVNSQMNMGLNHLHLGVSAAGPPSLYGGDRSNNASRTSLVSNLQQQRGISQGDQRSSLTSPMSPVGHRVGFRVGSTPRRAPIINPNPRAISEMPNPTAENPTKGFPWAFPDSLPEEDDDRRSSSAESDHRRPSRHNSFAASMTSSIFTNDSRLPEGQKRFSEDVQTHHHSMMNGLRPADPGQPVSPGGLGSTYSRTPELRVSHKMAERKRRSEMKGLFDELSNILPSSAGGKSSKWEVLTRAIEHINATKKETTRLQGYRQDFETISREHEALRKEAAEMWHNLQRLEPTRPHIYGNFTSSIARDQTQGNNTHALPPMQNGWTSQTAQGNGMPGLEYSNGNREFGR